jgi:dienelactone hydrolase
MMIWQRCIGLLACALGVQLSAWAQSTPTLDESLHERVEMIRLPGLFPLSLETTFFVPDGPGPFPVVIINHGKSLGDPRFQARARPIHAVRYFMQRGYAVVAPMRRGFSKSSGMYVGAGCNIESNGRVQADDVRAVLDHVVRQPWADTQRILMVGQSHGGWTTLAFGTQSYPGLRGLVNFAGGLRQEQCPNWEAGLAQAAAAYGKETKLPSLWLYGDNDSYFSPAVFRPMHERYVQAGGQATLAAYGAFGADAHALFASAAGVRIWHPLLNDFLRGLGLPSEPQPGFERYAPPATMPSPPPSGYAALEDASRLPHVRDTGRAGYQAFLASILPRAYAVAPSGAWGWASGGADPLRRALDNCNKSGQGACRLYAVDEVVVWPAPQ